MPVSWRRWFIQRINQELEKQNGKGEGGENQGDAPNADIRKLLAGAQMQSKSGPRGRRF